MQTTIRLMSITLLSIFATLWVGIAQAIPAWSKQYEKDCSSCHTAWPQLNKKGREFKLNGYRMEDEVGDKVEHDGVPWAINFIGRPYDKRDTQSDARMRALHEVELFVGGAFDNQFSGFFEIEFEDEIDGNSFGSEIGPAMVAWNLNPAFNLQALWGNALFADPYGYLGSTIKLTRAQIQVNERNFGGADGALIATRQSVNAWGRVAKRLFYTVGLSGEDEDALGVDARNLHARLAVDITDRIMIGGLLIEGEAASEAREYTRYGVDAQIDVGDSRFNLVWFSAEDDVCGTATNCTGLAKSQVSNDAYSVQWFHTFQSSGGRPTFVPLIRFDNYETNNGTRDFDELVVNLSYYFRENVKAYVEFWDRSAPNGMTDDDRLTFQVFVAF